MYKDVGSDINMMCRESLGELIQAKADLTITKFMPPRKYAIATLKAQDGTEVSIECDCKVVVNTKMQIRHAKSLIVQNMSWLVTPPDIIEPLIGRLALEVLGLNLKDVLGRQWMVSMDLSTQEGCW